MRATLRRLSPESVLTAETKRQTLGRTKRAGEAAMTHATASPRVDRTIRLDDGRQMAYAEWGDLQGQPVILPQVPSLARG
jgi:hypothetical protein